MWRLSDHKERIGGAPGREVELLLGGTQQNTPQSFLVDQTGSAIVWKLCVAVLFPPEKMIYLHIQ